MIYGMRARVPIFLGGVFFSMLLYLNAAEAKWMIEMILLKENSINFEKISIGMSKTEVLKIMREETVLDDAPSDVRTHRIKNPVTSEVIHAKLIGERNFTQIEVLNFSIYVKYKFDSHDILSRDGDFDGYITEPVYLRDSIVIGKGISFYRNELILKAPWLEEK